MIEDYARLSGLETRVNLLERAMSADGVHTTNVERRLDSIEETLKWLMRLVIGAVILALVGYALGGELIVT